VTETVRREQTLEEQRDGLRTLNKMLRRDGHNDLQPVRGYTEMLNDHIDEDGERFLAAVQKSATHGSSPPRGLGRRPM
jgi:hypothetical protein